MSFANNRLDTTSYKLEDVGSRLNTDFKHLIYMRGRQGVLFDNVKGLKELFNLHISSPEKLVSEVKISIMNYLSPNYDKVHAEVSAVNTDNGQHELTVAVKVTHNSIPAELTQVWSSDTYAKL